MDNIDNMSHEGINKLLMARFIKEYCTRINQCENCVFFDDKSKEEYNHCLISSGVNWPQHWQI